MANEKFVSTTGLYRIKDKIASATESDQAVEADQTPELPQEEEILQPVENKPKARNRQFDRALQMRHEEYRKLKRDISTRYAESIAAMSEKLAGLNASTEAVNSALELITEKQREIDGLQEEWDNENYTAELAAAMKTLENLRLELIRQNSRLAEKTSGSGNGTTANGSSSLLPELSSLSFKQLARMGFMFFSPLLITLLIVAIIIGAAVMMSMRMSY